ncbi:Alpha-ketoglutarate permease [Corynebacterium glaucum]|uniref:MFS transporter n=1 Tax=Corynebacterium glaucum TaxID=187491 RepID=UPI0025B2F1E7|nr:MFS transporter [Corynebacterium glaucum]WJZ08756.1 Alpha-ketoglutarate permease [Corynebacterium glaucum]
MTTAQVGRPSPTWPATPQQSRVRDMLVANLGNVLEWYDWNVYTIFAPFLAIQFFNHDNPTSALLSTLAVFAVGFVARPIGRFVFGAYADRVGRKQALVVAMMTTAVGSLVIGFAPGFDAVGVWASVILVAARLIQGLAHGGEMGTAVTYLVERAPEGRRAFFGSTSWTSVVIGTMTATMTGLLINALLTEEQVGAWGWRIPFIIGGVLGLYALWLRRSMSETDAFNTEKTDGAVAATGTARTQDSIWSHWRGLVRIFLISAGGSLFFYTWSIYLPTHVQVVHGQSANSALSASLIAEFIFLLAIPLMGMLGDHIGRKPMVMIAGTLFVLITIPIYRFLDGTFITQLVGQIAALVSLSFLFGVNGAIWTEALPTRYRAVGVATMLSAATAIFGGTAPYLNTWLSKEGYGHLFPYYLVAMAAVTLLTGALMKETKDLDLKA